MPWEGFNFRTLSSIFEAELSATYCGPALGTSPADLRLYNEDIFESLVTSNIMPVVNAALSEQRVPTHYGKGPDVRTISSLTMWSCIFANHVQSQLPPNLVPGDTKISSK